MFAVKQQSLLGADRRGIALCEGNGLLKSWNYGRRCHPLNVVSVLHVAKVTLVCFGNSLNAWPPGVVQTAEAKNLEPGVTGTEKL
jgi:hypothetical protein